LYYENLPHRIFLSIFCFNSAYSQSNDSIYQQVISIKYLTLKEGVELKEAKEFLETEMLQIYRELPGFNAFIGRPDPNYGEGKGY